VDNHSQKCSLKNYRNHNTESLYRLIRRRFVIDEQNYHHQIVSVIKNLVEIAEILKNIRIEYRESLNN